MERQGFLISREGRAVLGEFSIIIVPTIQSRGTLTQQEQSEAEPP